MSSDVAGAKDGVVVLDYAKLVDGADLSADIERAYGYDGIGLLIVRGIPGLVELRQGLLPLGFRFAALPNDVKDRYVHERSSYSFGWSHGKEVLKPGQFDEFKGSYYNNPQYDSPQVDASLVEKYPENYHPNVWPDPDFPALRPAFQALGRKMVDVGLLVAAQCDRYVTARLGERLSPDAQLARTIRESRACKARLLYYFAINEDSTPRTRDSWCGWHSDHGSLTGLCPAMYFDAEPGASEPTRQDIAVPDPEAGLYVRTRGGEERKVVIPKDCLAFQIGESAQIVTGGLLRATPHAVQALAHPASRNISRSTFAVFMQPDNEERLRPPEGTDPAELRVGAFQPGMTFGDFARATFAKFYNPYA
ncbi:MULTISPECIES: 2-oxoglutarate and iron-dependent oxygenase domain-containing protein [Myxococcus]|uniref:Isopenicillin N synthase family oxygenase n=1 Tax=Myxococcus llanfairpwllgwyngyllgogerychwyrndrobwllllantysiliogogogochensis TaxID=2590453 RepID=A0A540X2S2_9BACT|nr:MULTISPECIES: 2-oxoglutarate and iron-dependent oxygenase domain-containing protein [Myxococcus]NTX07626.1 isopenicillin N synthase family oxygenase [Myxococcus sp. CA040A]TQF15547.1 isopenicillin N synthase family oxygenase [Myxococcus llanfairpwllgwyngyllgogerychwyrndrobwllllantysiliogogogochensis]